MNLTTVARVKDRLAAGGKPVAEDDASADDTLLSLIRAYSAIFEQKAGRSFETVERTEVYDVDAGSRVVCLRAYPIASEADVEVRNDATRAFDSAAIVDPSLYYVDRERGHLILDPLSPACGLQVLKVTYTAGLGAVDGTDGESSQELIDVHPALADACEKMVLEAWARRDGAGAQSTSFGDGSRTYEGAIKFLPEVEAVLGLYRRMSW